MRILLDTHILLSLLHRNLVSQYPEFARRLTHTSTIGFVSVVSLWEIAIKTRLGKLDPGMKLGTIAGYIQALELEIVPIDQRHVVEAVEPEPPTRDPFDRLLLAQCEVEDLLLMTVDRALADHRLAMKL